MKPRLLSAAHLSFPLATSLAALLAGHSAQAASQTWGANSGTAWYTAGNWAGNAVPGLLGGAASNTDIATFTSAFTGTTVGINMNAGGNYLNLGAISVDSTRTTATTIGNSSTTVISGNGQVLRLYGATVNSVANTIVRNAGSGLLTIQNTQGSGNQFMGVVLGNTTNNINIDGTGGVTISSNITQINAGSGLTKGGTGAGILTLSGANSYTGKTTISAGTLQFAKAVSLYNNNTAGTGWTAANIVVANTGTLALNVGGTGEFTTGNVTTLLTNLGGTGGTSTTGFAAGSSIAIDTTNASGNTFTVADTIANSTGTGGGAIGVTKLGSNTLVLSGANSYTGTTTISAGTLQFAKAVSLYNINTAGTGWTAANIVVANAGTLALNVGGTGEFTTGDVTTLLTNLGGLGGTGGTSTTGFAAGSSIAFDTTNASGNTFTVADTIANSTGTGGGAIGVTKLGSNTLVLTGPNSYSGATNINAGTLALSGGNNRLLSTGTVAFAGTSTLDIGSTSQTLAAISVPNATSNSTINGSGGTLTINGASNLEWGQGTGAIVNGRSTTVNLSGLSNFAFNASSNIFRVGYKSGTTNTNVTTIASQTVTLAASNTITASVLGVGDTGGSSHGGNSTLLLGAANILNVGSINVGFVGRSDATLDFNAASSAVTIRNTNGIDAVSSWNIGLINTPTAATFTDSVNLSNGTVDALVTSMTIGLAAPSTGSNRTGTTNASFTMAGGTLTTDTMNLGQFTGVSGTTVTGTMAANGTFTLNSASGTLNVTTLNLATNTTLATGGTRNVSGIFNLTNGTLNATTIQKGSQTGTATATTAFNWTNGIISNISGGDLAIINTPITLFSGNHTFDISGSNAATLDANSAIGGGAFDITKSGSGTLTFNASNTYTGINIIGAGTLAVTTENNLGQSTLANSITFSAGSTGTLQISGSSFTSASKGVTLSGPGVFSLPDSFDAASLGGEFTGAGSLTKAGAGTLTLSGVNTYTGGTSVTAGTLLVDNSIDSGTGTGAVTIGANGTLGGSGTISGDTTINGKHNAGNPAVAGGVGTQTFGGNLSYGNDSIFNWDLNANKDANGLGGNDGVAGSEFDAVAVAGNLSVGTNAVFNVIFGSGVNLGDAFWSTPSITQEWSLAAIFGKTFASGSFASVTSTADPVTQGSFTLTGSGSTLTWTAVPEPTSALAGLLIGAGLLRRRRA